MDNELIYKIAISLIPGIGNTNAKKLIAYAGGVKQVFSESKKLLQKVPGIGSTLAKSIVSQDVMKAAEAEVNFTIKNNIETLFFLDDKYPQRLKACIDAPVVLFNKGKAELNNRKFLSIVGTRSATEYGANMVEGFVSDIYKRGHNITIVSGLAYGIDIAAHRMALKYNLPTIGVLAHGLNTIYPAAHKTLAHKMTEEGNCLVTDFSSCSNLDKKNFVLRNRIIAGLSDATIVVESAKKGGALITAEIANSYNRDVFAFPGRNGDTYSEGCNFLIKSNRAALIENILDLEYIMNWEPGKTKPKSYQPRLFNDLTSDEQKIVNVLKENDKCPIDIICIKTSLPMSVISPTLLNLEFAGIVKGLPGKIFKLI